MLCYKIEGVCIALVKHHPEKHFRIFKNLASPVTSRRAVPRTTGPGRTSGPWRLAPKLGVLSPVKAAHSPGKGGLLCLKSAFFFSW